MTVPAAEETRPKTGTLTTRQSDRHIDRLGDRLAIRHTFRRMGLPHECMGASSFALPTRVCSLHDPLVTRAIYAGCM